MPDPGLLSLQEAAVLASECYRAAQMSAHIIAADCIGTLSGLDASVRDSPSHAGDWRILTLNFFLVFKEAVGGGRRECQGKRSWATSVADLAQFAS